MSCVVQGAPVQLPSGKMSGFCPWYVASREGDPVEVQMMQMACLIGSYWLLLPMGLTALGLRHSGLGVGKNLDGSSSVDVAVAVGALPATTQFVVFSHVVLTFYHLYLMLRAFCTFA